MVLINKLTKYIYIFFITFLIILCFCSKREHSNPLDPGYNEKVPPLQTKSVTLSPKIPVYVRLNPLPIGGKAEGYTKIFCIGGLQMVSGNIDTSGLFNIIIPIFENKSNILFIFAKDKYSRTSDTTQVKFIHTTSRKIHLSSKFPSYSNMDYLSINGSALGFSKIYCEGGQETTLDTVQKNTFSLNIPLIQNNQNNLLIYGTDSLDVISDSLQSLVIHDNIPPELVYTNIENNGISYNINNVPFVFKFANPIYSFKISIQNSKFSDYVFKDQGKSVEVNYSAQLDVGRKYAIQLSVQDSAHNVFDYETTILTYFKKIDLNITGMRNPFFSYDDKKLFIPVVFSSNLSTYLYYIRVLDLSDWTFKDIPLPNSFLNAAQNPYNHLIYVTTTIGLILIINPDQGQIINTINLVNDYPNSDRSTGSIGFAASGIGIVNSDSWEYKLIDLNNNLTLINEFRDDGLIPAAYNDYKILILYNADNIYLFNQPDNSFVESLEYSDAFPIYDLKGNRHRECLLINSMRSTYLIDENSDITKLEISYVTDFTYFPGEDNCAYFINIAENHYNIGIADFNNNQISVKGRCEIDPRYFVVTPDGKYLILFSYDKTYTMHVIEPKTFR